MSDVKSDLWKAKSNLYIQIILILSMIVIFLIIYLNRDYYYAIDIDNNNSILTIDINGNIKHKNYAEKYKDKIRNGKVIKNNGFNNVTIFDTFEEFEKSLNFPLIFSTKKNDVNGTTLNYYIEKSNYTNLVYVVNSNGKDKIYKRCDDNSYIDKTNDMILPNNILDDKVYFILDKGEHTLNIKAKDLKYFKVDRASLIKLGIKIKKSIE